jgi:hypothetical protein
MTLGAKRNGRHFRICVRSLGLSASDSMAAAAITLARIGYPSCRRQQLWRRSVASEKVERRYGPIEDRTADRMQGSIRFWPPSGDQAAADEGDICQAAK